MNRRDLLNMGIVAGTVSIISNYGQKIVLAEENDEPEYVPSIADSMRTCANEHKKLVSLIKELKYDTLEERQINNLIWYLEQQPRYGIFKTCINFIKVEDAELVTQELLKFGFKVEMINPDTSIETGHRTIISEHDAPEDGMKFYPHTARFEECACALEISWE